MKTILTTLSLLLFGTMALQAQDIILISFLQKKDHKWGYKNEKGKIVLPAIYEEAGDFSEGLGAVKMGDTYGYIDRTGRVVIAPKYYSAGYFQKGVAMVRLTQNGQPFYIDKTGREVDADSPVNTTASNLVVPAKEPVQEKKEISNTYIPSAQVVDLVPFKDANDMYGYKDKAGKVIISTKYSYAGAFQDGMARIEITEKRHADNVNKETSSGYSSASILASIRSSYGGVWGYVDHMGKEVIPPKYHKTGDFAEGLAAVSLGEKYGYIDKTGREVIPFKYEEAGPFSEGLAVVALGEKYGFIDKMGNIVIPFEYETPEDLYGFLKFENGKVKVRKNGREFYMDKTGREVK